MTDPTPAAPKPPRLTLPLNPSEDLANLIDRLTEAAKRAAAAKEQYDALRTEFLAAVTAQHVTFDGDTTKTPEVYVLVGTPVRVTWSTTNRVDTKALARDLPSLHAKYLKPSGGWKVTGL